MSPSPRHLWSGDWQLDSAAAAEELANRRAQGGEPAEPQSELPSPRSRASAATRVAARLRSAIRRLRGTPRPGRAHLRGALLVAALVLLTAGAAFGVTLLLNEQSSTTASGEHPWLGIDVAGSPLGVVVTDVVPGSPAQAAGLERGDLITGIDNQPVGTVDSVSAALDGAHTGSRIEIQFSRGPVSFTTQATLGAPPAGSP